MTPSPKRSPKNNYPLSKEETIPANDDDDLAGDRSREDEDERRLRRLTSRVQSYEDGSAEAILATGARTTESTNTVIAGASRKNDSNFLLTLSNSPPLTRTKSTPAGGAIGGNARSPIKIESPVRRTSRVNSPGKVAYALRKVFSREEKDDWREQEAEELVNRRRRRRRRPSEETDIDAAGDSDGGAHSYRYRSPGRVISRTVGGDAEGEGAEVVLVHDDVDDRRDGTDADPNAASRNKNAGYELRRFLSTPGSVRSQEDARRALRRRTPSYEPEGHDDDGRREAEYDEDHEGESPLFFQRNLRPSGPAVGFRRTLSSRRKKSSDDGTSSGKSTHNAEDEDLSTVAESVDSSSSAAFFGGDGKRRGRRSLTTKRILAVVFLFVVGIAGAVAYAMLGDRRSGKDPTDVSSENRMEDFSAYGGSDGDDAQLVASWDAGEHDDDDDSVVDGDQGDADVSISILTDDGDVSSRASHDTGKVPEDVQAESKPIQTTTDIHDPYPSTPAATPSTSANSDNGILTTASPPPSPPPTANPSERPTTAIPSDEPTGRLTSPPTADTYTKFYVMADCPYDDNERENIMPSYISNLSADADFLFHLGDLQYAKVDDCQEYAYREASAILRESPVATFVLPGDNDINDCDDHEHGERMWEKYFHRPDERWGPGHSLDVTRWGALDESFSFLHKGVLYFGLNIVGGSPYSKSEKRRRHKEHLEYVRWILDETDDDDFRVVVLLGHADPSYGNHEDFFDGSEGFAAIVEDLGKPTVHFHGDYHEWYEVEGDYDVDNYVRISLDGESVAPPILVEIDVSRTNPVRVSRRRDDLDVDCCAYGWPRRDEL